MSGWPRTRLSDFGALQVFAKRVDGGLDFDGVLAGDGNLFTAEFDCAVDDGGLDLAINVRGDGNDVGELEVGCAKR